MVTNSHINKFLTFFLIFAVSISPVTFCLADEATDNISMIAFYEIDSCGFRDTGDTSEVHLIKNEETGGSYFKAADIEETLGFTATICNNITKSGSSYLAVNTEAGKFKLFNTFYQKLADDSHTKTTYVFDTPYIKDANEDVYISENILPIFFSGSMCSCQDGGIAVLRDNGKTHPGTGGLNSEQRHSLLNALFMLYVRSNKDYSFVMRFNPTFMACSPSAAKAAVGRAATAYVYYNSPVIYISTDTFETQTCYLAALIRHEATHWSIGYQGLCSEDVPTECEIRTLINLGTDKKTIQRRIDDLMEHPYYKNGAQAGQKLLDAELNRQSGEKLAKNFTLAINEKAYSALSAFYAGKDVAYG